MGILRSYLSTVVPAIEPAISPIIRISENALENLLTFIEPLVIDLSKASRAYCELILI